MRKIIRVHCCKITGSVSMPTFVAIRLSSGMSIYVAYRGGGGEIWPALIFKSGNGQM